MKIIIHRGTKEVGGSCVEICSEQTSILIDFGLPLAFEFGEDISSALPEPLYTEIESGKKTIDAVFLSHAHLDHFGLISKLPDTIPVYMGQATYELIKFVDKFTPNSIGSFTKKVVEDRIPLQLGDLEVVPYQMDHSAFDSYAYQVNINSKSVFYTGDFRGHGLNRSLFDRLIADPPKVDVLLMEGTVIGERQEESFPTETEIQDQLIALCKETEGTIFVSVPSQNIDRIISLSNAAMQTNRKLIIDLYSAELFHRLESFSHDIPQPDMPHVRLWYPWIQCENLRKYGLHWVMKKHRQNKNRLSELSKEIPNSIFMIRPPFRKEIERNTDLTGSIWVYSMWKGYLNRSEPLKRLKQWTKHHNIPFKFLHTSGHAKISDLQKLASALSPKILLPIHSFHVDHFRQYFQNVKILQDSEVFEL